ncbi:ring-opening amidohydrolase [Leptolyngbya sp. AN02str]|uniref:cyanuric acid amidohydrolase n=1 Tax=Leptolyngbya sp. AN02str TaxID=3423363 RepID=UPI003D31E966
MQVNVFKIPQQGPDDVCGLAELVEQGRIDPASIVAILGKTEGNGCVNDFTRGFAVQSLQQYLAEKIGITAARRIIYVMSGGTEGVLSPHLTVFTREPAQSAISPRWGLVLGTHHTRDFLPEEIGSLDMVHTVADGVKAAIAEAGLEPEHVHFVQIKCPLVTAHRTVTANPSAESAASVLSDSYKSMAYSRGASALGVAIALGEVAPDHITAETVCRDYEIYSRVASTSAGVELRNCEILVLGNAPTSTSAYVIGHSVMQHALDTQAIHRAIAQVEQPVDQIVNIFAKAEADPSGYILNRRHTMLDDSDISHTRMARAVVGAVVASVIQDPMVYVSGGSEHQGPPGGGPVAVIARRVDLRS